MCGIAGIISSNPEQINSTALKRMSDILSHRGPDGEGIWINPKKTAGLAHRRLAILDLSSAAAQPMHFRDRYSIVYNGEIYNHVELKKELQKAGYHFKTESDTEVILAAFDYYKESCLQYLDGMFAFAIWDEVEQYLFAARDRFGEKPFFFHKEGETFIFASEMKAIWAAGVSKQLENRMLLNYITLGYVQNPAEKSQTFFKNIFSLPPSHYLILYKGDLQVERYWNIDKQQTMEISEEEAIYKLNQYLDLSVKRRLRSDVPVGISLSGGLDSSALLYYMHQVQGKSHAFSAIFPSFEKNEKSFIDQVTDKYPAQMHTVIPNEAELISDFERLMYHQEEPLSSSSVYAQYEVFKLAKENNIKVLLSGQGADEVLAGYDKYIHWFLQELVSRNKFVSSSLERLRLGSQKKFFNWGFKNIIAAYFPAHVSIALEKREFNKIMNHPDISRDLMNCLKGREWEGIHKPIVTKLNDILYFNMMQYGLEELLRFSDRNAMANGCESRLPFLQHELVSFIFYLPTQLKIKKGHTKYILRKMMEKHLPQKIVWRNDKVAFETPQKKWMESPFLKAYLHDAKALLVQEGILRPESLQRKSRAKDAHDPDNFDWRYLCIAQMLRKP